MAATGMALSMVIPFVLLQPLGAAPLDLAEHWAQDGTILMEVRRHRHRRGHSQCFLSDGQGQHLEHNGSAPAARRASARGGSALRGAAAAGCDWDPRSVKDLAGKYEEIFGPFGMNRNAASHLWSEYILSRASCLTHEQIVHMFSGFCPVSGSPLPEPSSQTRYKQSLVRVGGKGQSGQAGYSFHCCWPCHCDEKDHIKLDTKTVKDKSGASKKYTFEVIGDPCKDNPPVCGGSKATGCIPEEAPAVRCRDGKLQNFIASDAGHVIIGMYHADAGDGAIDENAVPQDGGPSLKSACEDRKKHGFQGGMGEIFIQVASLNPL